MPLVASSNLGPTCYWLPFLVSAGCRFWCLLVASFGPCWFNVCQFWSLLVGFGPCWTVLVPFMVPDLQIWLLQWLAGGSGRTGRTGRGSCVARF